MTEPREITLEELKQQAEEAWRYYDLVIKSMDISTFNQCPLLEPAWSKAAALTKQYEKLKREKK